MITSLAGSGATLGFLMASITVIGLKFCLSPAALSNWGWRVPFIAMGLVGFVILYYRIQLTETEAYLDLKQQHAIKRIPLWAALKTAPGSLLKILGLTCMSSIFYILFFGYMPVYLAHYTPISSRLALGLESMMLFLMLFLIPVGGMLGDRFGRKKMLLIACFSMLLCAFPCYALLQWSAFLGPVLALGIAVVISSIDQGSNLSAFVENCPPEVRYSGIGFAYNLGNALFGGTIPLLANVLTLKIGLYAPAFLIVVAALVSLTAILHLPNRPVSFKRNRSALSSQLKADSA